MKFSQLLHLESMKENMRNIFTRFPLSVVLIFGVTLIGLSLTHGDFSSNTENILGNLLVTGIATFFLSVGVYISSESVGMKDIKRNLLQIIPLVFGVLFHLSLDSNIGNTENIIFIIVSIFGIISYLFFAPYFKKLFVGDCEKSIFYTYFYKVSMIFLIAFILGGVLFTLGNIALAAVDALFDLAFISNFDLHETWGIFALIFLTPLFALTQMPDRESYRENHFNENQFFSFLIKYIATPFIYLYFIILYAYSLKVLINFGEWPKGEVSWMVIGFSIFGYATYIFSYIFEQKNKFIKIFRSIFPYAVIPQIFMLFYAIYLRIAQYDITINRYFVVIFGLWLLVISLYFVLSKKKNLVIIPSLLTLFTLIISVGPWGVYTLPEARQYDRLEQNLRKAGILEDGIITPLSNYSDIEKSLSTDIYSGIQYVCDFNNCEKIKTLFPDQYQQILDEYNKDKKDSNTDSSSDRTPSEWKIVQQITDTIKVKSYYNLSDDISESRNINLYNSQDTFPIDIKGYSSMLKLIEHDNVKQTYATLDLEKQLLLIQEGTNTTAQADISQVLEKVLEIAKKKGGSSDDIDDLSFELGEYKIIFDNISLPNPDYQGENTYDGYYSGYLLIK